MRGTSCSFHPQSTIDGHLRVVSHRLIAIVALSVAAASGAVWAFVELGRAPTLAPVAPIAIGGGGEQGPGGRAPGTTDPEGDGETGQGEPGGSGDSPSAGAEPPPAPLPPAAGGDDDDDGDGGDGDDGDD
jgi:hypothetical protein